MVTLFTENVRCTDPGLKPTHPGLRLTHPGLRPTHPGLRPTHPGLRLTHPGLRPTHPGLRPTHPGLRLTHPGLRPTHPGLRLTHPGLRLTHPGLLITFILARCYVTLFSCVACFVEEHLACLWLLGRGCDASLWRVLQDSKNLREGCTKRTPSDPSSTLSPTSQSKLHGHVK